jgi:hypothetical protein
VTGPEYKLAIACLRLSQVEAGKWLGYSQAQSNAWANSRAEVPIPVAKLLRLMVRLRLEPSDVP